MNISKSCHRFLFIDINASHICPTRVLFAPALELHNEIVKFGAGFVDEATLKAGVKAFIVANGHFDGIIITPPVSLYGLSPYTPNHRFFRKFLACQFPLYHLNYNPQILQELFDLKGKLPLISLFFESDLHDLTPAHLTQLEQTADYYFGLGPDLWKPLSSMPSVANEPFGKGVTNCYWEFVQNKANIFASIPQHCVDELEFCTTPLANRYLDWSVIGMNYVARKAAANVLSNIGVKLTENAKLARLYGRLKRFNIIPKEQRWALDWLNANFRERLQAAKFSYTCGSQLDMPIRKFFEIPSSGGVLVCKPCNGFEHLGFIHGKNCFAATADELPSLHEKLMSNLEEAQNIACAGQEIVRKLHTTAARGAQMHSALSAIVDGNFKGAKFTDGVFKALKV